VNDLSGYVFSAAERGRHRSLPRLRQRLWRQFLLCCPRTNLARLRHAIARAARGLALARQTRGHAEPGQPTHGRLPRSPGYLRA